MEGKARPARKADKPSVSRLFSLNGSQPYRPPRTVTEINFAFFLSPSYGNKENATKQASEREINKNGSLVSKGNSINIVVRGSSLCSASVHTSQFLICLPPERIKGNSCNFQ
jgi:hypothetical protein